jgi:CheY-like chemotaxis protein
LKERRRDEQTGDARHQADKIENLGVLAGAIAHEFNNILTAITGNLLLAKMYAKPELEVYDILTEAEKAAHRAEDLTRQLLTFSRGFPLFRKPVPVRKLLESLPGSLPGAMEISVAEDLDVVNVDEGQIRQSIRNLIINARQAMSGGGVVGIRAEKVVISEESSQLSMKAGEYVRISVEDSGPGIEEAVMEKIFDPFFTTKKESTGLGLTTSYSIVKNHGGYITVQSEMGSGTTVHIYLPYDAEALPQPEEDEVIFFSDRKRILVMDDEEIVRTVLDRMLAQCGCETSFAAEGEEMVRLYKQAMEEGRPFDAVIVDLIVSRGMGGREAIGSLLALDPHAKAIVSSGYSDDGIMSDYRRYGFKGVLAKPYNLSKLSNILYSVIAGEADKPR